VYRTTVYLNIGSAEPHETRRNHHIERTANRCICQRQIHFRFSFSCQRSMTIHCAELKLPTHNGTTSQVIDSLIWISSVHIRDITEVSLNILLSGILISLSKIYDAIFHYIQPHLFSYLNYSITAFYKQHCATQPLGVHEPIGHLEWSSLTNARHKTYG